MKIRRKTNCCLNCNHTLSEVYNFCPHCGQENNDNNVSFGTFIGDFFSNYFSFDTRIGRSIQPFFLRPGYLTNQFNDGKRTRYVHPLRLYLVVSLVFFFLISLQVDFSIDNTSTEEFGWGAVNGILDLDSLEKDSIELIKNIVLDANLSDEEALDSLAQIGQKDLVVRVDSLRTDWFGKRAFGQGRRLARLGLRFFVATLIKNLPFVLLVAMPLFALLLKGLYVRRRVLYVQHLVHTLHLHSFSLVLFSLLVTFYLLEVPNQVEDYAEGIIFLLLLSYVLLSFRRVYEQSWIKTVAKMGMLGLFYLVIMSTIIVSELLVSFMIF